MNTRTVRALVIDDEPLARQAIRTLLADVEWMTCVGEAEDGPTAVASIQSLEPDVVFLDIQMPGANGIEVLSQSGCDVAVIFTTAFDDYAMTAFELGAIDYLRKPFGRERFMRAVERARPFLEARLRSTPNDSAVVDEHIPARITDRLEFAQGDTRTITRLFVRDRARIVPISVAEVLRFESDGDYVAVVTGGRRHLIYINISELAERLDSDRFVRVHRSHIVNLDHVSTMAPHDPSRLEVRMSDGSRVVASRSGTQLLRARLK
jgi:two-component system LytT family response regulator